MRGGGRTHKDHSLVQLPSEAGSALSLDERGHLPRNKQCTALAINRVHNSLCVGVGACFMSLGMCTRAHESQYDEGS